MAEQLGLPFSHTPSFSAADFLPADSNAAALAWLNDDARWPDHRLALWGDAGCGKTHLLHVWADRVGGAWCAGPTLPDAPAGARALAIDNADAVPEEALLHTLNHAAPNGVSVLLAARHPPARWPVRLPDLASRLRAITAVPIAPAEESLLRALLRRSLAERQLSVPAPLQDWLLLHLPRTPAAMREIAARLDREQLARGRGVTRKLLGELIGQVEGD